ncbi:MAG TPA: hypothetical protein PK569_19115 [Thermoanaerobaculia bacterium]|nr:hypothetical protein [Thermoanaerobaculia bacterium]
MADTLSTVTAKTRALLGDQDAQLYADSFLVTYVGMAQSQLDSFLAARGVARYRKEALITVPAGTTELTLTTVPALPADFVHAVVLHERPSGSTKASDWIGMSRVRTDLPNLIPVEWLGVWNEQGGALRFVGATTDRQIQLDYMCVPAEVALPGDTLPMANSAEALAYLTAALVAESAGAHQAATRFWSGPTPGRLGGYLLERDNLYSAELRRRPPVRRGSPFRRRASRLPFIT